jgi:hypothetical protein
MGEPPGQPPAIHSRQRRLDRLKYLGLVLVVLSGPMVFSLAAAKSFAAKDVDACQDATQETPWDWAAERLRLTFDQKATDESNGWAGVVGDRNADELIAFTTDHQKVRMHSASWPVQPKANAELYYYSPGEVVDFVEQSSDQGDGQEEWTNELRRDVLRGQWIARNSVWHWNHPDRADVLDALSDKDNEAAARQLAIWRVVDGLRRKSYSGVSEEISRRTQELVEFAAHYAPAEEEMDLGTASLGAWSARTASQVLINADVTLSDGTKVPNQPLTFDFPGGRVLAHTDRNGRVCVSLPETSGEMPPTVAVRWERYVPAGSYFGTSDEHVAAKGADEHMDRSRALDGRPFMALTLNGFRATDQLTLSIPPRE